MSARRRIDAGGVGEQRLEQRRFSLAVPADQHDFLAAIDYRAEAGNDRRAAVGLGDPGTLERDAAGRPVHGELDVRALDVRPRQLGGLQPLHFLPARRHLAGARAGVEPGDEVVELRDLLLPLLVVRLHARPNLRLGDDHVVVAAGIRDDRLVVDVGDVGADGVEEVPVVRDDDQCPVIAHQKLAHPVNGFEVEMVGRLVEQERLGMSEERLRQQHAHLLAALQLAHRPLVKLVGDVEPLQQNRRIALRGVAVLVADDALELAEAHAVLVGHRGLRIKHFALLERLPQAAVAHDDRVDDAEAIEGEMILAQHAELGRSDHRALLRRQLAREQLHERGLAGAIRARSARSGGPPRRWS